MPSIDVYADFVEFNVSIVAGSVVGTSLSACCLISTFEESEAFPDRAKDYTGTPAQILEAVLDDGFATTSAAYRMTAAFVKNVKPINRVKIGRRDAGDDADLTASLAAIIAEDNEFFGFCVATRVKSEQLAAFEWAEQRGDKFFVTYTQDPLALQQDPGSLPLLTEALQIKQGMGIWYNPALATKYGPAIVLSASDTFSVPHNATLVLAVGDELDQTFTFPSTAASVISGTNGPYAITDTDELRLAVNGGAILELIFNEDPEYFPDTLAAASAAQVAAFLNDHIPGINATADGLKIRITSTQRGTGSSIEVWESNVAQQLDLAESVAQLTTGTVVANNGDTVGLKVDALADLTVVSTASAAGTATLLRDAWNGSAAHAAVAEATISGADIILEFFDHTAHTVLAVSPAVADVTPINNTKTANDATASGTGFAANANAATAAEVAALIDATLTDATASAVGAKVKIASAAQGEEASITISGGTMVDEFGLVLGDYTGTGTTENYLDCQILGRIASFDLDAPNGSVGYDNQTVPQTPGNTLKNSQRKAIWNHHWNTYEAVTSNRPGELHPGECPAGFDADVVWGAFWFRIRGSERVKLMQDTLADRGERINYDETGVAKYDQVLRALAQDGARNGIIQGPELLPKDPLGVRKTYFYTPTIAEQTPANRDAGIIAGFEMYQLATGSAKAIKIGMTIQTP